MELVRVQCPEGKVSFHKMAESQIAEHILRHLDRAAQKAFNYGGSAIVDGWTYKVINISEKTQPVYFSN